MGRDVACVYFSHEWIIKGKDDKKIDNSKFPLEMVNWIHCYGAAPFIRLMLRSSNTQFIPEPYFTLQAIVNKEFDTQLKEMDSPR